MEDIIDLLREAHVESAVPLDLPDEDQVVEIEEEILIAIPYDLRVFLLEASDIICGALEPVTVADPRSHTFLPEVTSRAWDMGMPREYIVICEYNNGFANIAQDGKVSFWRIESKSNEKEWETFWHWAQEEWLPG